MQSLDSLPATGGFNYAVIRLKTNDVMLEGKFNRGGYVKWVNDSVIEVLSIPNHVKIIPDSSMYKRQVYLEGIK